MIEVRQSTSASLPPLVEEECPSLQNASLKAEKPLVSCCLKNGFLYRTRKMEKQVSQSLRWHARRSAAEDSYFLPQTKTQPYVYLFVNDGKGTYMPVRVSVSKIETGCPRPRWGIDDDEVMQDGDDETNR